MVQAAQDGTFTASGRSDNYNDFFFLNFEVDVVKDRDIAELLTEVFDFNHCARFRCCLGCTHN